MPFVVSFYQRGGPLLKEIAFEALDTAKDFFQTTARWFPCGEVMILLKEQVDTREEYLLDVHIQ
jgi:hypothetical protein